MKMKRILGTILVCATFMCCFCVNASATGEDFGISLLSVTASGRFNMDVPGKTTVQASSSFPLEAGEVVTIKASYSPFSASVDFGLIAPDGLFYSVNVTGGSIDQAIEVNQRGNYTFAVQNNSSETVKVSGFVNY